LRRTVCRHEAFISEHLFFTVHDCHQVERITLKFVFGDKNTLFENILDCVFGQAIVVEQREVHGVDTFALGILVDTFLGCPD
tara:strand:+ start:101 stop:346 length:246 start_codon:yes stop_codon:yes gene_type:complete